MPFDLAHKRTEAEVEGAPQVALDLTASDDATRQRITGAVDDFAQRGFRSLGVASTQGGDRWCFLEVIPLFDQARDMGIQVKMATGDQVADIVLLALLNDGAILTIDSYRAFIQSLMYLKLSVAGSGRWPCGGMPWAGSSSQISSHWQRTARTSTIGPWRPSARRKGGRPDD